MVFAIKYRARMSLGCGSRLGCRLEMTEIADVEMEYQLRIDAMTPAERFARSAAMFAWTREQIAIQIRSADPNISNEVLKWRVAERLYESEPEVLKLIRRAVANVPS